MSRPNDDRPGRPPAAQPAFGGTSRSISCARRVLARCAQHGFGRLAPRHVGATVGDGWSYFVTSPSGWSVMGEIDAASCAVLDALRCGSGRVVRSDQPSVTDFQRTCVNPQTCRTCSTARDACGECVWNHAPSSSLRRWARITSRPRQSMNGTPDMSRRMWLCGAEVRQGGLQREHRAGVDFAGDDDHSDAIRVSHLDT